MSSAGALEYVSAANRAGRRRAAPICALVDAAVSCRQVVATAIGGAHASRRVPVHSCRAHGAPVRTRDRTPVPSRVHMSGVSSARDRSVMPRASPAAPTGAASVTAAWGGIRAAAGIGSTSAAAEAATGPSVGPPESNRQGGRPSAAVAPRGKSSWRHGQQSTKAWRVVVAPAAVFLASGRVLQSPDGRSCHAPSGRRLRAGPVTEDVSIKNRTSAGRGDPLASGAVDREKECC